jgi:SAM-dependent methyltransferase
MQRPENYLEYNRAAWNHQVRKGNRWTVPVGEAEINAARNGEWKVVLTPRKTVPLRWFADPGSKVLGLASGGGQQGPLLAAAGYDVTIFDNSEEQLEQDRKVSDKFDLGIKIVQGDMADLSVFDDESFDMVFNPLSISFVPDVLPVYREVARVLKPGGIFLTAFTKPVYNLFDVMLVEKGIFTLKYSSPYSDVKSLDDDELKFFMDQNEPLVFGHSLDHFINGQLKAGLMIMEIMEDDWGGDNPVDKHFPAFVAVRSVKGYISF